MRKYVLRGWLVFALLLAGCATLTEPGPTTSPVASPVMTPAPTEVVITFHRSGGFSGRDETWQVYGDGRVTYVGNGTGQDGQLAPDRLAALIEAARAARFDQLQDSYVPANTCCDRFFYDLTITLDGRTKTVHTIDAAPDQPAALTQLLNTLNDTMR